MNKIKVRISLIFTASLAFALVAVSQSGLSRDRLVQELRSMYCQTIQYDRIIKMENTYQESSCQFTPCDDSLSLYAFFPVDDIPMKYMRVRWVSFTDDDGRFGSLNSEIEEYLRFVNSVFNEFKFHFITEAIIHIPNTRANHDHPLSWLTSNEYYEEYAKGQDSMFNIFIVNDFQGQDNGLGNLPFDIPELDLVYESVKHGTIVISRSHLLQTIPRYEKLGLVHEIGHTLGLLHTFEFGHSCDSGCREMINASDNGRALMPYMTGDFIGDTYPEPYPFTININRKNCSALYDGSFIDKCTTDEYRVLEKQQSNIMNYYTDCRDNLTTEQVLRMHCIAQQYYNNYFLDITSTYFELEPNNKEYVISPNPNSSCFKINNGGNNSQSAQIQVMDLSGKQIYSDNLMLNETICLEDVNDNGVYVIRIITGNGQDATLLMITQL